MFFVANEQGERLTAPVIAKRTGLPAARVDIATSKLESQYLLHSVLRSGITQEFSITDKGYRKVEEARVSKGSNGLAIPIPPSDKVVHLDHQNVKECDEEISNIIVAVEKDNGDPEHPGLRERLIGQLKAGRELVRCGQYRAYLLYETLVRALAELIEKYGNESLKALANALLGAVFSRMLGA